MQRPMSATHIRPWRTLTYTVLLGAAALFLFTLPGSQEALTRLHFPGESAGRMVDRHLDFYEGYEQTRAWERALHSFLFGSRQDVQNQAVAIYREVLQYFNAHPDEATPWAQVNTKTRLLVTLAETEQWRALDEELADMRSMDEEMIRDAILFAYTRRADDVSIDDVMYGARLVPLGWASDRLYVRIADKLGGRAAQASDERLRERGRRWRARVFALFSAVGALLVIGIWLWRRGELHGPPAGRSALSRWGAAEGFAVLVRAALFGLLVSLAFAFLAQSYFRPGVLALWSTLFASLPMLWFIQRDLLRPRGLSFARAFGLRMPWRELPRLGRVTVAVLALEWCGTLLIAWLGWKFGLQSHWSEGLYEREIFGPWQTVVFSSVNLVIWAPIFEEIAFRGVLYGSLRSRLAPRSAMVVSAALFSALHLYSLPGFLAVFWSGLVLAYAYERFGSLWPCILVHSAGNLLTLSTVLLFYR